MMVPIPAPKPPAHDLDLIIVYRVSDDIEGVIEIEEKSFVSGVEFADNDGASNSTSTGEGLQLKQAYIAWAFAEDLSLTVGWMDNWLVDAEPSSVAPSPTAFPVTKSTV